MRTRIFWLGLCTLLWLCEADSKLVQSSPKHAFTAPKKSALDVIHDAERAVVMIMTDAGQGSGVVIGKNGIIVTNFHVIKGVSAATIKTMDGKTIPLEGIIESDESHDLALVKAKTSAISYLALGDSSFVRVGQKVLAIGNPLGLQGTVSDGLISAIRLADFEHMEGAGPLKGFKVFQTTSPISPGSSGGALIDENGKLIGITFLSQVNGQNLNFAIPINYIKPMIGGEVSMKFSQTADSKQTAGYISKEFLSTYSEIAQTIIPSIADLIHGVENMEKSEDRTKADQLFFEVKSRMEGLSSLYNIKTLSTQSDLEARIKAKLADTTIKIIESSDTFIRAFEENQARDENVKTGLASFDEGSKLFLESLEAVLKSHISSESRNVLITLLKNHPLIKRGQPYIGIGIVSPGPGDHFILCVYPNSPADKAGIRDGDIIHWGQGSELDPIKWAEILYHPQTWKITRGKEDLTIQITPVLYGFDKKPITIGIAKLENESRGSKGPWVVPTELSILLNEEDNVSAFYMSGFHSTMDSKTIADEAEKCDCDYVITGKVTKYESVYTPQWNVIWGNAGYHLLVNAELNLYDKDGHFLATYKPGESRVDTDDPKDEGTWSELLRKFSQKVIDKLKNSHIVGGAV